MTSSDPPGALTDASVNGTIKRLFSAAPDSGHGGDAMIRSSNPIMFFVQVLLGLLFVPAWLPPMNNAPSWPAMFLVTDQVKPMPVVFHRLNIAPGGAKMTSSDQPGALTDVSVNGTLKRLFSAVPDSGHGGDAMIQSSNPIMFFVQGHTAISTSTFYSVPKERPKRFVHANLLDVINPNESDFSNDEKSGKKVSGDSSDEGDAIQTEVEEAEEEVATSTDAPPVDRILQNMKRRYTWVKKDFDIEAGSFENNFPLPPAEPLSAVEYFDMFVSRSMLKAVVDESNKYYFQKHGATLNLTVKELTSVLGMFFRMGLVNMHRHATYYNQDLYENPQRVFDDSQHSDEVSAQYRKPGAHRGREDRRALDERAYGRLTAMAANFQAVAKHRRTADAEADLRDAFRACDIQHDRARYRPA
ncbi:hypothetical protein HPB51_016626 [Rhipicephalus microplus]|uniref:PiggyBac transposable element-derived protein domain-containing protein n=1 Tax=Rhipicephalus microplus TaxID=6941 RepID=A0A9J6EHJ4_RHIMP|nr:hypothetical protein HPB51_016626 [Rhipicephalus microplus]